MKMDCKQALDIYDPETDVMVEVDRERNILYVHIDGMTILRVRVGKDKIVIIEDRPPTL